MPSSDPVHLSRPSAPAQENEPTRATYSRYLAYLGLTVLGLLRLVVTSNYQVNPYWIRQLYSPLRPLLNISM